MIGLNPIINKISTESIAFQYDSKFGDQVAKLFQKIIDFRDETLRTHSVKKIDDVEDMLKIFTNFYTKTIRHELTNVVKKEAGVELTTIILNKPKHASGSFAVSINLETGSLMDTLSEVTSGSTGFDDFDNFDFDKEGMENIIDVANSLDRKSGKFKGNKFSKHLRATLYLDIGFAFVPDLLYIGIDKKYRLTSKELAGIVLHEIGHIVTLVEYVSYNGYAGLYCNQNLDKIKNDPNKVANILNSKTLLPSLKRNFTEIEKYAPSISKMAFKRIETLEMIKLEFSKKDVLNRVLNILSRFAVIILQLFTPIIILGNMIALCYALSIRKVIESMAHTIQNADQPMSREIVTDRSVFAIERLADEYVVLHQYGKYLGSGFKKILHVFEIMQHQGIPSIFGDRYSSRGFQYLVGGIGILLKIINPIICFLNSPLYEAPDKRLKRLYQNSYNGLKKANMSDEMKASLLKDLDNNFNEYKQFRTKSLLDICMYLQKFETLLSFPLKTIFNMLVETNYEEYSNLLENIDSILSNSLYATSARLSILK